jgi:YD repeat-containing protein
MKKIIYLLSITFLMLQSCSSGDSNTNNNPLLTGKLKRIHTVSSDGQNYYNNFFYDEIGQLIEITVSNESGSQIIESVKFTRNSNGKIINSLFNDFTAPQQINYAYTLDNNQNYLTCSLTYTPLTTNSTGIVYIYSGNKISQINHSDGKKEKYTYDSNGNVIKIDQSTGTSPWITYSNYTYDNKVNPQSFQLDDIVIDSSLGIGNNNVTSEINQTINFSKYYQYNYNSNNKPSTSSFTTSNTQSSQITTGSSEFFYY